MFSCLEYYPSKDAAYCLPCYLFNRKPTGHLGANAFTIDRFCNWKKVHDDNNCAFFSHMGKDLCLPHNNAVKYCDALMNQSQHIDRVIEKQTLAQIRDNRL